MAISKKQISSTISLALLVAAAQLALASTSPSILTTTSEIAKQQQQQRRQQDDLGAEEKKRPSGASSSRSGRMLNLDVMAGELGKEAKAAQERQQSGNRQSRILSEDIAVPAERQRAGEPEGEGRSASKKGGKKMSIKGFIPIVSLDGNGKHQLEGLDSDADSDASAESESGEGPIGAAAEQQSNLREQLQNSYGGQTSLGHASFAPSGQQQQQADWQQSQNGAYQNLDQAGRANRKLFGSGSLLNGLAGAGVPKRGLVSSLVPQQSSFGQGNSYYSQPQHQFQQQMSTNRLGGPMNLPPVQAASTLFGSTLDPSGSGGECICVPFFQCKSGFLSESQLSRSQLAQLNQMTAGGSPHQIPRSLRAFAAPSSQASDLYYSPTSQQQAGQMLLQHQQQQQQQQQQQEPNQQLVNDLIYEQLRKSIESSNLEQQLQQQEAYNQANQQHLSLIDERSLAATKANASHQLAGELGEERGLLSRPLADRRQVSAGSQRCGIMRTCCRIPPRSVRALAPQTRPSLSLASTPGRLLQTAPTQLHQLVASPSIQRPQNQYQLLQPVRAQQQQQLTSSLLGSVPSVMQDFNYQQQQQQQPADAYQMALQSAAISQQQQQQQQLAPLMRPPGQQGGFMQGRCGIRQTLGISGRVANADALQPGAESSAEFGEFPAHAAILKRLSPGDSLFVCSAVLISSQWLATAAHCVRKSRPDELKVRLGEWDVNRDDEFYPFFESNVREILLHPDFQPSSLTNDLALLRLEQPVDQQQMPHIAPACLGGAEQQGAGEQLLQGGGGGGDGQRCWVAGWGKDAFGQQGTFQSVLKKVDLPVVSHHDCELALKYHTKLGKHFRLHASNICAGGERGKDACEGDGGAGLYCVDPASGLSRAVGLVSWGVGCGQRGVPGVYVNLAHFGPWIEQVVAGSGEENVYLDARMNGAGVDAQAFKSIVSERSNFNASSQAAGPASGQSEPKKVELAGQQLSSGSDGVQVQMQEEEARQARPANETEMPTTTTTTKTLMAVAL